MKTYAIYEHHINPDNGEKILDKLTVTSDRQAVLDRIRKYQNANNTFRMNIISNGKTVYSK